MRVAEGTQEDTLLGAKPPWHGMALGHVDDVKTERLTSSSSSIGLTDVLPAVSRFLPSFLLSDHLAVVCHVMTTAVRRRGCFAVLYKTGLLSNGDVTILGCEKNSSHDIRDHMRSHMHLKWDFRLQFMEEF